MQRRDFALGALSWAALGLTGCGGGDGGGGSTESVLVPLTPLSGPELASATTLPAASWFMQTRTAQDGSERTTGQANVWDLVEDFSVSDGGKDEWDGALNLWVQVGTGTSQRWGSSVATAQAYSDVTAFGPALGVADGLKIVTFAPGYAILHPIKGSRLEQAIDLRGAATPITLNWTQAFISWSNPALYFSQAGFTGEPFAFSVVFRPDGGGTPVTLFQYGPGGMTGTPGVSDLSSQAGNTGTLSFEYVHACPRPVVLTSVSIKDNTNREFVANGQFANAGSWTVPDVKVSQNIQSSGRPIDGVMIRRMFFTQPDALWGRITDTFENVTTESLSVRVEYQTDLGSDGTGIIYDTPDANGRAITSRDYSPTPSGSSFSPSRQDPDVALVFGKNATVVYQTATFGNQDGYDGIQISYALTIPPGETVTLVNFLLMSGQETGLTATDGSARATELDTAAADIANNFRTHWAYQRGMLAEQLSTVYNF